MRFVSISLATALLLPSASMAQDASDSAAYRPLTQTPVAAFAPVFDVSVTGERAQKPTFRLRYGLMSYRSHDHIDNFGVGVDFPMGGASLGFTAGYRSPTCSDHSCPGHFMAGANLSESLAQVPLGRGTASGAAPTLFNIGLDAELGYASAQDTSLLAGKAAVPFSIVPGWGRHELRLVPYVAPGVGVGLVHGDSTKAGLLFTLGAGVGLITSRNFAANVGIQRAFLRGGNWLVGVGVSIGGRRGMHYQI